MKTRESGMPEEALWRTFFTPDRALEQLGLQRSMQHAAEFGCGYGTFTIPAARVIRGNVHAFDIEPGMIAETRRQADQLGLANIVPSLRDFVADGTGLPAGSMDYAMLFNILHAEDPLVLLRESRRILADGGVLGVMHWNDDPATPRGPSLAIRPWPEEMRGWIEAAGFSIVNAHVNLPPYHYGIVARV